jgi:hypothetical protein
MAVAVLVPAAYVLREIAATDRPAPEPDPAGPSDTDFAEAAPELVVAPVLGVGTLPAAAPVEVAAHVPVAEPPVTAPVAPVAAPVVEPTAAVPVAPAPSTPEPEPEPAPVATPDPEPEVETGGRASMLAGLSNVEADEHSPLRRAGALVLLLVVTFAAAAIVAAGIYRAVAGLG